MARFRRRVRRTRSGQYAIALPDEERAVIRELLDELRDVIALEPDDPRVRRLYPTAYPDDPAKDAEFARFMHNELRESRSAAIDTVDATLDSGTIDGDQLGAWMQALNSVRLVIGTALDVSEDDDPLAIDPADPEARSRVLYGYLGYLLEEIVQAAEV
jgi:Domain of unknown function (DUF2017)